MDAAGRFFDLERPPLDEASLHAALVRDGGLWTQVVVSESTGSTNSDVAAQARAGAPEGLVRTTDAQTQGRGRLDRTFIVPERSGVIVSILLRPPVEVALQRWVWLPLLGGLAVDATARECGVQTELKWPNDVLVGGRKISGILLERVETPTGPAAVVGIGLNVTMSESELPVPTATSLLIEGAEQTDRTVVLRMLLRNLEALYRAWVATDGDPEAGVRDSYRRRCVTIGSAVRVELPDGTTVHGTATDVDQDGRIVVDGRALSAGDVTHVRPAEA
ncbi:biotin--[acetyl-CoA-carboxylase] ligase [Aeromicrobium sp. CTD01-1L150]|uniref:biotin--[acetyl-CoA-carboxylase] ligase n=1 Tax=Aeromicrobium sp. CTD01-1L150 TaxID=3341830 RepID=UPI0035C15F78